MTFPQNKFISRPTRLLKLEKDSGLSTKKDFADLMGATEEGLRKWQTGKVKPNTKHLFALVENFTTPDGRKINPVWLLTGEGDPYIYI